MTIAVSENFPILKENCETFFFPARDGIRQKNKSGNLEGVGGQKRFQQGIVNYGKHDYLSFSEEFKSQYSAKIAYMQPQLSGKGNLRADISQ